MGNSVVVEVPFKKESIFLDLETGKRLIEVPSGAIVVRKSNEEEFLKALLEQYGEREASVALASAVRYLAAYTVTVELVVRKLPLSTEL